MAHKKDIRELKVELLCRGARIAKNNVNAPRRKAGAGPAAGGAFIFGGTVANVPTMSWFVSRSPFIVEEVCGKYFLTSSSGHSIEVKFPNPKFYDMRTADGIPYKKIALLHGVNCLATTTIQTCVYWHTHKRCKFCAIEISLQENTTIAKKKPEDVAEVAIAAMKLNGVRHVTLTTGTTATSDRGIYHLLAVANAIKNATNLPIHAQFEPPKDLNIIGKLYDAVDTVGIHVESFDRDVLSDVAPCKAEMFEHIIDAWKYSVDMFGENQVSSYVIVGLGESDKSVIEGSKFLAEMGVYPYVVPLRPIPGSQMEHEMPPNPERMKRLYAEIAEILHETGISWRKCRAGCVKCRACSALPDFER